MVNLPLFSRPFVVADIGEMFEKIKALELGPSVWITVPLPCGARHGKRAVVRRCTGKVFSHENTVAGTCLPSPAVARQWPAELRCQHGAW